jgi:hypothetical protein
MPLALSVTSVTSVAYDIGDNEMILGLFTDLLAFTLQLRKAYALDCTLSLITSRLLVLP